MNKCRQFPLFLYLLISTCPFGSFGLSNLAWSADACARIDTTNPNASLQFLDLNDSGIKCVNTTTDQLPSWIKESVIPEVTRAPRGFIGRIKRFAKSLNIFHRPKQRAPCMGPRDRGSSYFFDRNTTFSNDAQNLLRDRAYQQLEVGDLWMNYEGEIVPINQQVQLAKEKENTAGKVATRIAKKVVGGVTTGLKVLMPSSDDIKVIRLGIMGVNRVIRDASVKTKNTLNFKSLLPDNSYHIQAVHGLDGVVSLVLGAAGLGLTPVTWGLSSTIMGTIREGTAIAAALAHQWWSGSKSRGVIFDKKVNRPTMPNLTMPLNLIAKHVASTVRSYLNIKNFHFLPFSRDLLKFMPVVGGALGIYHGLKSIYAGVFGYENGYELLRSYELVYKKIFTENLDLRKNRIKSVLGQAKGLLAHRRKDELNPDTLAEISCLCKAMDWLDKMDGAGKKKYDSRINYIDGKLRWKKSRLNPVNWFKKRENLEQYNREMAQYADEASRENDSLRSQLRVIDPGAEEILNIRIDSNNDFEAERQLGYVPPELRDANNRRRELDRRIAGTVSNTYAIAGRLWNSVASNPNSDSEIIADFPPDPPGDEMPAFDDLGDAIEAH